MKVTIYAWNVGNDAQKEYGPFEYVQLTYDLLRIPPEEAGTGGEEIACFDGDFRWNFYDGFNATDFSVSAYA